MNLGKARYWTVKDVEEIVYENYTENKYLEFKSLEGLHNEAKNEISKDVSAFTNSGGGVIIYGIREEKVDNEIVLELEEGLPLTDRYNKEWLEDILDAHISPKIKGLFINPVKLYNDNYLYVIVIPQSNTAHMAGNNRYYKRHNFKAEPMEDYEVRDVMNRIQLPRLKIYFNVPKSMETENDYNMTILLRNAGEAFVRHFAVRVCIPESIISDPLTKFGRRIQQDGLPYREFIRQSNPNQYIFPGYRIFFDSRLLPLLDYKLTLEHQNLNIYWTIYTDKSGPLHGVTPLQVIIRNRLQIEN